MKGGKREKGNVVKLRVSRFPFPVSLFPFPVSRFSFPVSRFPFPVSRFPSFPGAQT